MSIYTGNTTGNGLHSTMNLSNPASCTKLVWSKFDGSPGSFGTNILSSMNGPRSSFIDIAGGLNAGLLSIDTAAGVFTNFPSSPAWTHWNCYVITATTPGANSLKGYWRDNAGASFVSQSMTGPTFTITDDWIANGYLIQPMTMAFYMEWSIPLSLSDLNAQFLSKTPIVQIGSLRRYLQLTNAATAGTDTSGNGFNMIPTGLTDGVGTPTFPSSNQQPLLLLGA